MNWLNIYNCRVLLRQLYMLSQFILNLLKTLTNYRYLFILSAGKSLRRCFLFFILKTRKAASSLLQLYAHLVHVDQELPGTAQDYDTA